ncbi:MAG: flagellar filament capping protein FliD [Dehalococcoidia bacterium]|nr:flagellar filament capping protein FliD [Dehalococcoidia bacterium]
MAVASRPITLAQQRIATLENRQKALGTINSSLLNLLGSLDALRKPETGRARIASLLDSTQSSYLGVSASSAAAIGSFGVEILSLATATKATSTQAIGQPVGANVPLDEAGLDVTPTAGTFTINSTTFTIPAATATTLLSSGAVGTTVSTSSTLATAGLTLTPTSGTFEINGTSITFDASVDSLSQVIARINASGAGVTASFDSGTNQFTLTRTANGPDTITLSNTSGNFLEAMNLVDNANVKTGVETLGQDLPSLNDVVTMINNAGIGVTASLANDADGRPNLLQLNSASAIALGAGADTSNFLDATHLLESPGTTTRTSVRNLGTMAPAANLIAGRLATALSQNTGSFSINGVAISYDATVDSLNTVISRINQSAAGVTATYDSYTDKIRLTNSKTGTTAISLADTTGNFLAATGLLAATQATGTNASYRINGGATQYSTTNEVTSAVPGVTLTLKQQTSTAVNVQVSGNSGALASRLEGFVSQFNSTMGLIGTSSKYNEKGESGSLLGDTTLVALQGKLRSLVVSPSFGNSTSMNTLGSIGLTFGAVGSAAGSANTLVFDRAKFEAAMQNDPEGVVRLLTRFTASGTLDAGGTGSLASVSGAPTLLGDAGKYTITTAANGSVTATFTPTNGSTPITKTVTVAPGEVNTTLIAGMTLTFKPVLVDGTDTLTITGTEEGVAKSLYEFVEGYTRAGGVMAGRDSEFASRITDLNTQIERMQARVDAKRQSLILKYAALETTMQRLQNQQGALTNLVNQLSGSKS